MPYLDAMGNYGGYVIPFTQIAEAHLVAPLLLAFGLLGGSIIFNHLFFGARKAQMGEEENQLQHMNT